jgi:hypothetical protein
MECLGVLLVDRQKVWKGSKIVANAGMTIPPPLFCSDDDGDAVGACAKLGQGI